MTKTLTALDIENLGFKYQGLTKADEFSYEYWQIELFGCWLEVTNEYESNGTLKKQFYSVNDMENEKITQEKFLDLIKILKSF